MTVDEILATGRYTDRRGRAWGYFDTRVDYDRWQRWESRGDEDLILEPDEMRLLIERDRHRDVCRGLAVCEDHPVPSVNCYFGVFEMWPGGKLWSRTQGRDYYTLSAALDAARAWAVGE